MSGRDIDRARLALHTIDPGTDRETWVRAAMAAKAAGLDLDDFDQWSATAANYKGQSDCAAVWRSINGDGGIKAGTLYAMARESGWSDETTRQTHPKPAQRRHQQERHQRPAFDVQAAWSAAEAATDTHPYVTRKNGSAAGLRVYRGPLAIAGQSLDGALMVPACGLDGALRSIQFIPNEGKKLNAPGRPMDGVFVSGRITPPGDGQTVYIGEGIGQAWACNRATGSAAVVCFGAGRMEAVTRQFRARYPAARLVLVADAGKEQHCARIAKETGCAWVEMPLDSPQNFDANDLMRRDGLDALRALLASPKAQPAAPSPFVWQAPAPIAPDEWMSARPAPDCIVESYLFADVGVFIAPGGTGKTTLILFEAIHIALGWPLFGLEVRKPGLVLIVTAEDSREMLVARLRAISAEMDLTDDQRRTVRERVLISDVSGSGFKLTEVDRDVVRPAEGIEAMISGCKAIKPVLIVIDPAVSFGVGESRVNDAEQGLIEAARKLRRALNCCIRYVHHSGKANAREKTLDQYSGRGGSAFADGARMVTVLQAMTPSDWKAATGTELRPGQTGLVLARPKMSYAPPAGDILIRREGYRFEQVEQATNNAGEKLETQAQALLDILRDELAKGHYPTQNSLEAVGTGLTRAELRKVIAWLAATGRVENRNKPGGGKGGARKYLHPFGAPDDDGAPSEESDDCCASEKPAFGAPPPIGNSRSAHQKAPPLEPFSYGAPNEVGAPMAHLAHQSESDEPAPPSWASGSDWEAI